MTDEKKQEVNVDEELIKFPVTVGVVGVLIAPVLAAIGAIAALVAECKIVVVKK